jgi:hypothetical protein
MGNNSKEKTKMLISEFLNANKKAVVYRDIPAGAYPRYSVDYYIDNKIINKQIHWSLEEAQSIAEDFVYDGCAPKLLNEQV